MRTTFLVGKMTRRSGETLVVVGSGPSPIPGPWVLKAVVRSMAPSPSPVPPASLQVH
jgi:hypothetical protein